MKPEINLDKVSLQLPVYGVSSQSFKRRLINFRGGNVSNDIDGIVIVQALSDISFSLQSGDSLGLIGRNGAGKSTLLKVLAGIYAPTSGMISVYGKAVPLLDIGLGLDDQSTGRQNIRLRGLLIGMSNEEIRSKTDEIVQFAELENYIDLPLRTYSTGMRVRLAFSISTAIEAEIMLLDEVLGVGDVSFQEKAKKRLKELHSRTQIIVHAIHDERTILDSCNKALWLEGGAIRGYGAAEEVVLEYRSFVGL
jgi:ABC-type polysaccharide/polyol phosphate transport system ATPase subunit